MPFFIFCCCATEQGIFIGKHSAYENIAMAQSTVILLELPSNTLDLYNKVFTLQSILYLFMLIFLRRQQK